MAAVGPPNRCIPMYSATCSARRDGITYDMRSRKHAQTRPSPVPLALLLIDVLTTFQFPDGDAILQGALGMRDALVRLKVRAREVGVPVLYANDNFGDWRSEKEVLMGRCLEAKGGSLYDRCCRTAKTTSY